MQYNHLKPNSKFKDNLKFSICEQCCRLKFTVYTLQCRKQMKSKIFHDGGDYF